jgi:hypothetical protein
MRDTVARVLYDANGNAVGVTLDGAVYKIEMIGKLRNVAGTLVNPATEDTLSAADTKLGTIDSTLDSIKDTDGIKKITDPLPAGDNNIGNVDVVTSALPTGAATEVTLAAADTKLGTIDGVLDAIKDTDGIKKITDPLPAGDNNIGNVDVVTSALPTGAATETTLAAADTKLGTIDGVLDSIKDTDGIKKITDELPAGTQEIGSIAQGTPAAAANAWPVVSYTSDGTATKIYTGGGERIPAAQSLVTVALLEDMVRELKRLNMHMRIITEVDIEDDDMDEEGTLL